LYEIARLSGPLKFKLMIPVILDGSGSRAACEGEITANGTTLARWPSAARAPEIGERD
jgi:hypothetical protein